MSKFFINRPIVAMVISILMVLIGLVAMARLPIALFPNIADPQMQVKATYPGADAKTVDQSVATPIEQQMSGVDNMEYMYSLNANNGQSTITVDFNVTTDPNTDHDDDRISRIIVGLAYQVSSNLRVLADLDHASYQGGVTTPANEAVRSQALFQIQFVF